MRPDNASIGVVGDLGVCAPCKSVVYSGTDEIQTVPCCLYHLGNYVSRREIRRLWRRPSKAATLQRAVRWRQVILTRWCTCVADEERPRAMGRQNRALVVRARRGLVCATPRWRPCWPGLHRVGHHEGVAGAGEHRACWGDDPGHMLFVAAAHDGDGGVNAGRPASRYRGATGHRYCRFLAR